jgi:hypothetical protein
VESGGGDVVVVDAVEAWRTRQSEGVKNEDGVEVVEGGFAARTESFDRAAIRGLKLEIVAAAVGDEKVRLPMVIDEHDEAVKNNVRVLLPDGDASGRWLDRRRPNLTVLVDTILQVAGSTAMTSKIIDDGTSPFSAVDVFWRSCSQELFQATSEAAPSERCFDRSRQGSP